MKASGLMVLQRWLRDLIPILGTALLFPVEGVMMSVQLWVVLPIFLLAVFISIALVMRDIMALR